MKTKRKIGLRSAMLVLPTLVSPTMVLPAAVFAHTQHGYIAPDNFWTAWTFEPWVLVGIILTASLYIGGLRRMRIRPAKWRMAAFFASIAALALTLLSPLHQLGSELFSAHMTQHELLMLIAAPLLILSEPGTPMLWAFPFSVRVSLGNAAKWDPIRRIWIAISTPFAAWVIHGVTLWAWHIPVLYQATLDSELVHAAQHATFLGTALLFWWTLVYGRGGRMKYGAAVAYVFTTAVHTSVLGALLTCSSKLWYPAYIGRTQAWGLSALEDQQLGGLIMWVPAGLVYIAIGLWLFAGWLRESDRRLAFAQSTHLIPDAINERGRDA
jgi:putative membrane protein